MMENKTAMKDFLIHIREKRNILTRDYQNGRADYYVVRIFEMLEAEAFKMLEKEKEQIKGAWLSGQDDGATICTPNQHYPDEDYYNETYGK